MQIEIKKRKFYIYRPTMNVNFGNNSSLSNCFSIFSSLSLSYVVRLIPIPIQIQIHSFHHYYHIADDNVFILKIKKKHKFEEKIEMK